MQHQYVLKSQLLWSSVCMFNAKWHNTHQVYAHFPKKSRSHLTILGIRIVTWSKSSTEDGESLGSTLQNLVTMATWCLELVHSWNIYTCNTCCSKWSPTVAMHKR